MDRPPLGASWSAYRSVCFTLKPSRKKKKTTEKENTNRNIEKSDGDWRDRASVLTPEKTQRCCCCCRCCRGRRKDASAAPRRCSSPRPCSASSPPALASQVRWQHTHTHTLRDAWTCGRQFCFYAWKLYSLIGFIFFHCYFIVSAFDGMSRHSGHGKVWRKIKQILVRVFDQSVKVISNLTNRLKRQFLWLLYWFLTVFCVIFNVI